MALGELFVKIGATTSGLRKGLDRAREMLSKFGKQQADQAKASSGGGGGLFQGAMMGVGMKALDMGMNAIRSVGAGIAESAQMGASLNETLSKTGVLLGGASHDAIAFAQALQDSGKGQMGDILESLTGSALAMKGMGVETEKAIDLAKQLESRVADIASQDNKSVEEVRAALSSAMAKEFDPLKSLKVFINAEDLKKSGKPMGEAIAEAFLQQTERTKGDFDATKYSSANMGKTNDNTLKTMMTNFGVAIQPVVQAFQYLKGVMLSAIGSMGMEGFTEMIAAARETMINSAAGIAIFVKDIFTGIMTVASYVLQGATVFYGFVSDLMIGFGGIRGTLARMGLELAYRLAQGIDLLVQPFRWIASKLGIELGTGMANIVQSLADQRATMDQQAGQNIADANAKAAEERKRLDAALKLNLPAEGAKGAIDASGGNPLAETKAEGGRTSFSSLLDNAKLKDEKQVNLLTKIEQNTKPGGGGPGAANVTTKLPGMMDAMKNMGAAAMNPALLAKGV